MSFLHLFLFIILSFAANNVQSIPGQFIDDGYKIRHEYTQSIRYPYLLGDNRTIPFYDVFGEVKVTPNGLCLNGPRPEQTGAIWSQRPSTFKEWAAILAISVRGDAPVTSTQGMAFWYTKDRGELGPVFGSKDKWTGFGIFLDSYGHNQQSKNPAILAVYNDGTTNYYTGQAFAHCFKKYRNPTSQRSQFLLKMIYTNRTLSLEVDSEGYGYDYKKCFEYSPIYMEANSYFGVSAGAGPVPDTHDLISLDIYEINPDGLKDKTTRKRDEEEEILIKKHEELEKKLKESSRKKDKESSKVDLKDILSILMRIEENQYTMMDEFDQLLNKPSEIPISIPGHGTEKFVDRIGQLENQLRLLSETMVSLTKTTEELSGSHRGTQSVMNQLASLNQLTHSKLDDLSKIADRDDSQILSDKESQFYYYAIIFVIIQVLIVIGYTLWKRRQFNGPYDKKFL